MALSQLLPIGTLVLSPIWHFGQFGTLAFGPFGTLVLWPIWHFGLFGLVGTLATVAVWTQKPFTPLLTRPQGSQGSPKIRIFILQIKVLSSFAKIAQKRHKLRKLSKLKNKCQKKPVFFEFFEYSSIWGQS